MPLKVAARPVERETDEPPPHPPPPEGVGEGLGVVGATDCVTTVLTSDVKSVR